MPAPVHQLPARFLALSRAYAALIALLAVVGGLLLAASAASAKIVVGQGIAGVKLGDPEAQVQSLLGKPAYCEPCGDPLLVWGYKQPLMGRVGFDVKGRVQGVWTASPSQKTSKGIHPYGNFEPNKNRPGTAGSTEAQVKKAYPSVKCGLGPQLGKSFLCYLKSRYLGRAVVTSFLGLNLRGFGVQEIEVDFA